MNNWIDNAKFKAKKFKLFTIYMLLYIWILSATILSKAFTSILLETYFITKPSLTVETLDDIINKPKLSIGGRPGLKQISFMNPEIHKLLEPKVKEYENSMKINSDNNNQHSLLELKIVEDIYYRKVVLILDTFWSNMIKSMFSGFNLMESKNKYNLRYGFTTILKSHTFSEQIYRM